MACRNQSETYIAGATVQMLAVTHSPLIMASIEPRFDLSQDAWFDLDWVRAGDGGTPSVAFEKRTFVRLGEVSRWLMSDAFDLDSARSLEAEEVLKQAAEVLSETVIDHVRAKKLDTQLRTLLGDTDPFWIRWRYVGEKQGWLA